MNLPYIYWNKKKITFNLVVVIEVIAVVAAIILLVTLVVQQVQKRDGGEQKDATKSSVFKERPKSTFYDATFLSYNSENSTISMILTKGGFSTQDELDVSDITITKVTYDRETTQEIESKKIKASEITPGSSLRLIVEGADLDFNLDQVKEVQVLEPK